MNEQRQVRVAIAQEVAGVHVTVFAPCQWEDAQSGTVIAKNPFLLWLAVKPVTSGVKIGPLVSKGPIRLKPLVRAIIWMNGRSYRGSLIFYRTASGTLTIVDQLDLEEYLVGAVGSEVGRDWPAEALKAQVVVSRTMVAHRTAIRRQELFDITADTSNHLYYGLSAERPEIRQAVQATRDQILTFRGKIIPATFHANCGGHTEDASELWDVHSDEYRMKGRTDPYCRDQKHFYWTFGMPVDDFVKKLRSVGKKIGEVHRLKVLERNPSGRARQVRLEGTKGNVVLSGNAFREIFGHNRLRSLNFTAQINGNHIDFEGFGWGHGVGFCQWGAYGMALQGHASDEILEFYFPGVTHQRLK